ncbi:hypothetical protein F0U60_44845 [Archangium minus]|uniref:Lipoprotein n=1 Tax=Archangium minus TaxID=83450 RepID=A0ABY9X4X7_9BACT|nr:hypothetical protein F0U60_44845 [Archangium minus]
MHSMRLCLWASCLCVIAACIQNREHTEAQQTQPTSELSSEIITDREIEAYAYSNPDLLDGLPSEVPVVVSYKGRTPTVAFRIGCGSNYGTMLEAFGYDRNLTLGEMEHWGDLSNLPDDLRRANGNVDVPIITLRCGKTVEETRQQVLQVFSIIGATADKPQYYLRLRSAPDYLFSASCLNLFTALGVTDTTGSDLVAKSIATLPTTRDFWLDPTDHGLTALEINCYSATARPLPAPPSTIPVLPATPIPFDRPQLFVSDYPFDGVRTSRPLYLISNGLGYAIDCGSNRAQVQQAFGFGTTTPELIAQDDPRFLASHPNEQPVLHCRNDDLMSVLVFESPASISSLYYRFNKSRNALFRFSCSTAAQYFETTTLPAPDGGTTNKALLSTRQALDYLLFDRNQPEEKTRLYDINCAGPSESDLAMVDTWFASVFGRPITEGERSVYRATYNRLWDELRGDSTQIHTALVTELEAKVLSSELPAVVDRALAAANPAPNIESDCEGHHITDYLKGKVTGGGFGAPLRANFSLIRDFIQERAPRLVVRMRTHFRWTYGITSIGSVMEKGFNRGLMEDPDDDLAFLSLQRCAGAKIFADSRLLETYVGRGVSNGKRYNIYQPGLDDFVAYTHDVAFFKTDVGNNKTAAFETGIYQWVYNLVQKSHAPWRRDLIQAYDDVFGCVHTSDTQSECAADEGISWWTGAFYRPEVNIPATPNPDFSLAMLRESHEFYLQDECTPAGSACAYEIPKIVERACKRNNLSCSSSTIESKTTSIRGFIKKGTLKANYPSIECYVRTKTTTGCNFTYIRQ